MSFIRRTNWGGSVAIFIVVVFILAVGLIGSMYYVVRRGEQARKDQAIATYETEKAKKTAATTKPAEKPKVAVNSDKKGSTSTSPSGASATQALPETGLNITASKMVGLYLLSFAIASYLVSRRELASSL